MKKILSLIVLGWVTVALFIQLTFVTLSFTNPDKATQLARRMMNTISN